MLGMKRGSAIKNCYRLFPESLPIFLFGGTPRHVDLEQEGEDVAGEWGVRTGSENLGPFRPQADVADSGLGNRQRGVQDLESGLPAIRVS